MFQNNFSQVIILCQRVKNSSPKNVKNFGAQGPRGRGEVARWDVSGEVLYLYAFLE